MNLHPGATLRMGFLVLGLLFATTSCERLEIDGGRPEAVEGVLDLRGWHFERAGPVRLDGAWSFSWKTHLDPKEAFAADAFASSRFVRVPGTWNGIEIDGRPVSGDGYATYRLKVLLPRERDTALGLKVLSLSSAYAFFVNGRRVASCGVPGASEAHTQPRYQPQVVPLHTASDTLAVTCRVSNFHHWEGGFWEPVTLGSYEGLREARNRNLRLDLFLLGSILVIGLYHLLLFGLRRQEPATLFFGLFCLMLAVRTVFTGEGYAVLLFPGLGWSTVQKSVYVSLYLALPLFALYARELFPNEIARLPVDILKWGTPALALIVLVTPPRLFTYSMPPFQLVTLGAFVYGAVAVIRALHRGRDGALVFALGFGVFFAAAVNDILYSRQVIQTAYIAPVGFLAFIVSQAGLLSARFSNALSVVEQQGRELSMGNRALEEEIENRRRAEAALRTERDRLETITKSMGAGLAVISRDYKVLWANRVMREMCGDVEGETCYSAINRGGGICPGCGVREVLEENRNLAVHEQVGEDAEGRTVWSENIATPIRGPDGTVQAALELVVPVTERKALEEQLRHAQKMEAVGTLASGVAHQFNNALNVISLNLGLLEMEDSDTAERTSAVETMKASVDRMSGLTSQLLAFAGGGRYRSRIVSLRDFVLEALPSLEHELKPSVRLVQDIPEDVHRVAVDPTQFQIVLSALLLNASEAIDGEGTVRITARNEDAGASGFPAGTGPFVHLTIEDSGQGMDAETAAKVFDPFFTTKFKGRGLSMAAVYGIVENHGGRIDVRSEPGQGTRVSIRLPAADVQRETRRSVEEDAPMSEPTAVILLIEDEPMVMDVTSRVLARLGYRVIQASNGEEALEQARSCPGRIDLVLLDVMLPDIGGLHLYPLLMETRPDLNVIVCSAYGLESPVKDILEAGAQAFLQKPYTPKALSRAVHAVLNGVGGNEQKSRSF